MRDMEELDSDEEDEETLQLQLKEIQARLKLKKLQKKARLAGETDKDSDSLPYSSANILISSGSSRTQSRAEGDTIGKQERLPAAATVHVPASPVRRAQPEVVQRSPSRVLLGIDKGLKGSDISLRRAPSLRKNLEADFSHERRTGPFLQKPMSFSHSKTTSDSSQAFKEDAPTQTFSERMAAVRSREIERQDRDARIKRNRSTTFDIGGEQMDVYKSKAVEFPDLPSPKKAFSRDDILNDQKSAHRLVKSQTVPDLRTESRKESSSSTITGSSSIQIQSQTSRNEPFYHAAESQTAIASDSEPGHFESFSRLHLSRRILPPAVLTRNLSGKQPFVIADLLRTVKAPEFNGPDIEEDVVVFAVIAQKSEPRSHQANGQNDTRGKYMIMTLTDLKWELELFLFGTAFDKFWKITPGTVIAILNPGFMPPPRNKTDTGRFSLTLNSNNDTILEIGSARDLGFCKSVKKDGKTCNSWIDKRHTDFCEFHVSATIAKAYSGRMEVNGGGVGRDYGKRGGGWTHRTNDRASSHAKSRKEEDGRMRYDRESHTQMFISARPPSKLLDDVDFDPDPFHRGSTKEERLQRKLVAKERERELARKLAQDGSGLGADYMQQCSDSKDAPAPNGEVGSTSTRVDCAARGLLARKAADVRLSPVKRKWSTAASAREPEPMGWGTDLRNKLGKMKQGENLQPLRKKTRFMTDKGIREAGRESLGGDAQAAPRTAGVDAGDSDDGLEIVAA